MLTLSCLARPSPFSKVCAWRSHALLKRREGADDSVRVSATTEPRLLVVSWAGHGVSSATRATVVSVAYPPWWMKQRVCVGQVFCETNTGGSNSDHRSPAKSGSRLAACAVSLSRQKELQSGQKFTWRIFFKIWGQPAKSKSRVASSSSTSCSFQIPQKWRSTRYFRETKVFLQQRQFF